MLGSDLGLLRKPRPAERYPQATEKVLQGCESPSAALDHRQKIYFLLMCCVNLCVWQLFRKHDDPTFIEGRRVGLEKFMQGLTTVTCRASVEMVFALVVRTGLTACFGFEFSRFLQS